jgi:hypothetical protein
VTRVGEFSTIGRLFWEAFLNYRRSTNFYATLSYSDNYSLILIKNGWATFWAIFPKLIWSPWRGANSAVLEHGLLNTCCLTGTGRKKDLKTAWPKFFS